MDEKFLKCLSVLNLPANATSGDIELAYQRLSRDIHEGSLPWEQSKEILWAYDYLQNCISETKEIF